MLGGLISRDELQHLNCTTQVIDENLVVISAGLCLNVLLCQTRDTESVGLDGLVHLLNDLYCADHVGSVLDANDGRGVLCVDLGSMLAYSYCLVSDMTMMSGWCTRISARSGEEAAII